MKNKAPLALMEQLVMLVVFALAAALCLQIFVFSGDLSRYSRARSQGVTVAQNAAEILKYNKGDLEACARQYGGSKTENGWQMGFDQSWQETSEEETAYLLRVTPVEEAEPLLGTAEVTVSRADGNVLVQLTVSWQEDMP